MARLSANERIMNWYSLKAAQKHTMTCISIERLIGGNYVSGTQRFSLRLLLKHDYLGWNLTTQQNIHFHQTIHWHTFTSAFIHHTGSSGCMKILQKFLDEFK